MIQSKLHPLRLKADPSRVVVRPFHLAWQGQADQPRAQRLVDAVLKLDDRELGRQLKGLGQDKAKDRNQHNLHEQGSDQEAALSQQADDLAAGRLQSRPKQKREEKQSPKNDGKVHGQPPTSVTALHV